MIELLALLSVHFVADFVLQSDWMAQNKSKRWDDLAGEVDGPPSYRLSEAPEGDQAPSEEPRQALGVQDGEVRQGALR